MGILARDDKPEPGKFQRLEDANEYIGIARATRRQAQEKVVRLEAQLAGAVSTLRRLYRVTLDAQIDADNVPEAREALVEAGALLDAFGGR